MTKNLLNNIKKEHIKNKAFDDFIIHLKSPIKNKSMTPDIILDNNNVFFKEEIKISDFPQKNP